MNKNKCVQLMVFTGLVLTVISLFLTLYHASFLGQSVSDSIFNAYNDQERPELCLLFLGAPILATLFILLKKRIPVIIFGLLQCGVWALLTSVFKSEFDEYGYNVVFNYGPAYYVGWVAAVLIVLAGIVAIATRAFKEPK